MGRYMDADKLLEYLEKEAESEDVKYSFIGAGVQATINEIKKFPLEDVKPVTHAHWIRNEFGVPLCSACHKGWDDQPEKDGSPLFEYCPCCGAIMDEEVGK